MADELRVLYSFPHTIGAPGIGTTALQQVLGLDAAGVSVEVHCTSTTYSFPATVEVVETLRVCGIRIPHRVLGSVERALRYHDQSVARRIRASSNRYDVVHTWPLGALATLRGARSGSVLASREVPNTHTANAYVESEREMTMLRMQAPRHHSHTFDDRRLTRELAEYAEADLLLVPSEHVEQTFLEHGTSPTRLARHQYGHDEQQFHARGRSEIPARGFTALFVGSAEPRKGLHYALAAWHRSGLADKGGSFVIAGAFVPGYRERLAGMLEHRSVRVIGFSDDVPALMRSADVLLLPSVEEGSALVTYEAQACGCIPLVSTATGAHLPSALRPFVHRPRDVPALTEHLARIADSASLRSDLRAGVIASSPHLTWQAAGRRMRDIFANRLAEAAKS